MKIVQILGGFVHNDITSAFPTLQSTVGKLASNIHVEEAPDYVREGFGFDDTKTGDERFVRPTAPEGWHYDDETGTFVPDGEQPTPPQPEQTIEQRVSALEQSVSALEQGAVTTNEFDNAYAEGVNVLE